MVLAINIGNTNITMGLQTKTQLLSFRILLNQYNTSPKIEQGIKSFIKEQGFLVKEFSGCIISSVVPEKSLLVFDAVKKLIKTQPILVSSMMDFGVDISLYDYSLIGTDRLLCCMNACYPVPYMVRQVSLTALQTRSMKN
jgi:type III pantothenate kinase